LATAPTASSVVRTVLSADLSLTADEVIKRAKAGGLKASPETIRSLVYNIRSELKKGAGASKALPVPAKPAASSKTLQAPTAAAPDVTGVLANVALVHRVANAAGGVEPARHVAEAVRACGGVDEFLQHLELIAGMQTS
jgi:hypothetical protein